MSRIDFLNIKIDNLTMNEAVDEIDKLINNGSYNYVVTPNLDHIVQLEKDEEFKEIYEHADLIVADGKPLIWISKFLKKPIKEKISGSDLFPRVCELAAKKGYTIFIMGSGEGIAAKAAKRLSQKYPGLCFVGTYSPKFGFEKMPEELEKMKKLVLKAKPDIMAVSLGAPKGEKFIYKHLNEYKVPLSMQIGATIDFEAENIKRAPKWMSNVGLEWLFRITQDPKRLIKRYWNDAISILPIIRKYR